IIALGSSSLVETTVSFFHAYDVALITTHSPAGESLSAYDNVFTTAPHLFAQIQAVLSVVFRQKKHVRGLLDHDHRVGVISGCDHALKILQIHAKKSFVEINSILKLDPDQDKSKMAEKTLEFIKSQVGFQGILIVLMEAQSVNALAEGMFGQLLKRSETKWVFAILDGESAEGELNVPKIHEIFSGAVVVEPHSPLLPGLNNHIENAIRGNHSIVDPLLPLLEDKNKPCPPDTKTEDVGKLCSLSERQQGRVLSGARATAAVKAISSLAAAFRLVQIEKCPTEVWCPRALEDNVNKAMLEGLMKLSYNPQGSSDTLRYTADGRLVSTYIISRVSSHGLNQVGTYREDTGVVWTHPLPGMRESPSDKTIEGNLIHYVSPEGEDVKTYSEDKEKSRNVPFDYLQIQEYPHDDGIIKEILMTHQDYVSRAWALSVLIISCVGIISSLYIGGYVAVKYCDGTITGPQFLGSLLLLGVICVYGSCVVYILPVSTVICHLRTWLPNMALTLCSSVLLVKGMQLRALISVGLGGEVSQVNLCISLIFMMGVQIAITLVGHLEVIKDTTSTPLIELDANGLRHCKRDTLATAFSQGYIVVLLLFGFIFGMYNRNISRNHNESRWLMIVCGVSTPIVFAWSLMNFFAPACLEPPTTCAACIILATLILVVVFIPKMKVIASRLKDFRHKRLSAAPSLSTIFTQLDFPHHPPLQPPAPFCDPPHKNYASSDITTLRSSYRGDGNVKMYPFDPSTLRTWRDHMEESPCIQRPPAPPPPPPPVRNPIYYGSSNSCYP
ncbi:Metabotropic glutamate receptor 2, partial [Armadillidium nasatum]